MNREDLELGLRVFNDLMDLREVIAVLPFNRTSLGTISKYRQKGYEIHIEEKDNTVYVYGYDKQTEFSMRGFWERRR